MSDMPVAPPPVSQSFPHLFTPIRIGPRLCRNRICRLATSTNSGANGLATDLTVAMHRRVAAGGAGLIVSESMRVHSSNRGRSFSFVLYRPEVIPSLRRVADAVHEEGALFIAQLNHGGRQHHGNEHPTLWAPSAVACPHSGGIPHAMDRTEIREVVEGFATAAANAREAGCAGIEIHGAQGHLIQEFLSPMSNRRSDDYGGSLINRVRFASEILSAVRDRVGPDFIVGYRMGIEEFWPGGLTVEDSKEAIQLIEALGVVDYYSLAQGNFNTLDMHLPDSHYPAPAFMDIQSQIKPVVPNTPVIASARINTPEAAEQVVASGQADMVGMCRALIADPELPVKAMTGRREEIVRCIGCNRCWAWILDSRPLRCAINPTVGTETQPAPAPAEAKTVVIVGGGPGGLQAACTAAEAGHRVVLFERDGRLGGRLADAAQFQPYHESSYVVERLIRQAQRPEISIRLGTEADPAAVLGEAPQAVIVATGARPYVPDIPNDGSVLMGTGPGAENTGRLVVMDEDGNYWAACVTEAMARRGCRITYVTRFMEPLRELPEITRISTMRELDRHGVQFLCNMFVDRCEDGAVVLRHYYNTGREERLEGIQHLTWIGAQRANDGIAADLRAAGVPVHLIGDAFAPRRLPNAIHEGYQAALATG